MDVRARVRVLLLCLVAFERSYGNVRSDVSAATKSL